MNKYEKEVEQAKLAAEARELKELKAMYEEAADQIAKNIRITDGKMEVFLENWDDLSDDDKSVYQSKIYQKNFQKQLQNQIDDVLKDLNSGQYKSIDEYLKKCYETGYIGAMYSIAGQGIPIIAPIDQKKVVKAIKTNSKIKGSLYEALGEDVDSLKKRIASSISRGIATADSYENIARNISNDSKVGLNNAMRIARTDGHRIHCNSAYDAMLEAKASGADVVKQWDASLDGKTRTHHRQLDGQIRELDEPFEIGGREAMYPADFGRPEEDINCRCTINQRARWALDEDELKVLKARARIHGLDIKKQDSQASKKFGQKKAKDFADFKRIYSVAVKSTITDTDVKAMYDYMGATSYIINDKLRNKLQLTPDEELLTIRLDEALDKMPTYKGNLQRSLYFDTEEKVDEFLAGYNIGEVITYKEYLSTTKGETYNPDGQVQIFIQDSKSGKDISDLNEAESEVLYKRDSSFIVVNMVKQDGIQYILMVEANE